MQQNRGEQSQVSYNRRRHNPLVAKAYGGGLELVEHYRYFTLILTAESGKGRSPDYPEGLQPIPICP